MRVVTFASGSSGNCTLVSMGARHFLIDAGISYKRIREQLGLTGLTAAQISGVLVTHEHSDHICGLATMGKRSEIPFFAPRTVANHIRGSVPDAVPRLREVPVGEPFEVDGVTLRAFHTPHDTEESVGWRLSSPEGTFALATDMGCVTEEILGGVLGADVALIEANHDVEMLRSGPYPYHLKRRILSDHGHLSNDCCAELAQKLAGAGTKYIILGHLSRENNLPSLAFQTVSAALRDYDTALLVAPAAERLTVEWERVAVCSL